jgi:WD40 repeat protein
MKSKWREVTTDVKVTALKAVQIQDGEEGREKELILAGVGGNVEVYEGGERKSVTRVFTGSSVHGFVDTAERGTVVVFGGKQMASLDLDENFNVTSEEVTQMQDWILDVSVTPETVLVLTAHNNLIVKETNTVVCCREKCILYSGRIIAHDKVILGGTVFREVVVWSYAAVGGHDEDRDVLHRLEGHEGVIFSIEYDSGLGLICSTSDDRTARIWSVDLAQDGDNWRDAVITPTAVLDASCSRVFRCRFIGDRVVTGGEDSTLSVWKVGEWDRPAMQKRGAHNGSPVWCLEKSSDGCRIFTGGGDGAVRTWPTDDDSSSPERVQLSGLLSQSDHPKVVRFHGKLVLCLTNEGKLVCFCQESGECHLLLADERLADYGLVESGADRIFLATITGHLIVHKLVGLQIVGEPRVRRVHGSKIFSLDVLDAEAGLVLTCGLNGQLKLTSDGSNEERELRLPACGDQRWVSCATLAGQELLLVGDRCGGLHLYDLAAAADPIQSIARAHGKRGVGDVRVEEGSKVWTAGRDGMLKTYDLSRDKKLVDTGCSRLPISWLERMVKKEDSRLIAGFHSSDFVLYSLAERRVVTSVACGGSHRSWDLDSWCNNLVFVKDKELQMARLPASTFARSTVRPAFHSREISVVHHFSLAERHFVATAGEDATIRLHEIGDGLAKIERLSLKSHISSVKSIKTMEQKNGKVVMVSAGGRAQIKVWRVSLSGEELTATETASHLLKGDDKRRKKTWRDKDVVHDAETRYMDVEIVRGNEGRMLVVAGCSDGHLRLLAVSEDLKKVSVLDETCKIDHCFLKLTANIGGGVLSTSTDGILRAWSCVEDKSLALKSQRTLNQSGCNAVAAKADGSVVTGGDDGTVAVFYKRSESVSLFLQLHSGQVTGLFWCGDDNVISCSVDQRLAVWKLGKEGFEATAVLAGQICTDVADVQAMAAWKQDDKTVIVVGGEGIALYEML